MSGQARIVAICPGTAATTSDDTMVRLAAALENSLGAPVPVLPQLEAATETGGAIVADLGPRPAGALAGMAEMLRARLIPVGVVLPALAELARLRPLAAVEAGALRRALARSPGPVEIFAPLDMGPPYKLLHVPRGCGYGLLHRPEYSLPRMIVDLVDRRLGSVQSGTGEIKTG